VMLGRPILQEIFTQLQTSGIRVKLQLQPGDKQAHVSFQQCNISIKTVVMCPIISSHAKAILSPTVLNCYQPLQKKSTSNSTTMKITNKRAQRALGHSPEEKVKGQGEAIILLNQILVENF